MYAVWGLHLKGLGLLQEEELSRGSQLLSASSKYTGGTGSNGFASVPTNASLSSSALSGISAGGVGGSSRGGAGRSLNFDGGSSNGKALGVSDLAGGVTNVGTGRGANSGRSLHSSEIGVYSSVLSSGGSARPSPSKHANASAPTQSQFPPHNNGDLASYINSIKVRLPTPLHRTPTRPNHSHFHTFTQFSFGTIPYFSGLLFS